MYISEMKPELDINERFERLKLKIIFHIVLYYI